MTNQQGMRPKGSELTKLYKLTTKPYEDILDLKWDWNKGEKKRVLQSFIQFCEVNKVRDRELLEEMMLEFQNYVQIQAKAWSKWDRADRNNYIGFLARKESIAMYFQKQKEDSASDTEIAGTEDQDEWSF